MEGCCQLKYFYLLWNHFDFSEGLPLRNILTSVDGYDLDEAVAFGNHFYILCYFPGGLEWNVSLQDEWEEGYSLQWLNPRNGKLSVERQMNTLDLRVTLPKGGNEEDWILKLKKKIL